MVSDIFTNDGGVGAPAEIVDDDDDDGDDDNVLTFRSSFSSRSGPVVVPEGILGGGSRRRQREKLGEFLLDPDHLLAAGSSVDTRIILPAENGDRGGGDHGDHDDGLLRDWAEACERGGASPPDPDRSRILAVTTAGITLPGLSVRWSALMGTTLVVDDDDDDEHDA